MIPELLKHLNKQIPEVKFYPQIMPQGIQKPAGVYTIINDKDRQSITGCIPYAETRLQLDLYAETYSDLQRLTTKIQTALYSFTKYPHNYTSRDSYEATEGLYRKIIEFKIRN